MLKSKQYLCALAIISIMFSGCSIMLNLQSTLPYETQQLIKTIKNDDGVKFTYTPHPLGDDVTVQQFHYSINTPFQNQLAELFQTKFGSINDSSDTHVEVRISDLKPNTKVRLTDAEHTLSMKIEVKLTKKGTTNSNPIAYTLSGAYKNGDEIKIGIENFMMKYIIAIDKYIDTQFLVQ